MEEYKPNSFKSKEEQKTEEKKVLPVVSTPAKIKKKSGWEKFVDAFTNESGDSISDYILIDVLVPAVKKTILDIVTNGIDMLLYGGHKVTSNIPASRVSYKNYYEVSQRNSGGYTKPKLNQNYNYSDLILKDRGEVDMVLNELNNIIQNYGYARVADLYDLAGLQGNYTDNYYGWSDLRMVEVIRNRDGGYLLKMPKPMALD